MENNIQYLLLFMVNLIRYFLLAGIPFLVFYILFPNKFSINKIQSRLAEKKDFIREVFYSIQTTLIIAAVGIVILKTPLVEYSKVYNNVNDFPIWWIPVSIVLSLVLHDTYFYWMHRTVHHPRLFRSIHLLHHKSVNPSPWASYSFHFFEGVLESLIAPILIFFLPLHPIALFSFAFLSFAINVYGHLGYEIAPKWLRHSFLFEILNTSVHHNLHHKEFKGNYGLYFRIWDRLMGTEHPDYVKSYDAIQSRRFKSEVRYALRDKILFLCLVFSLSALTINGQSSIEGKWRDVERGGVILIFEENGSYYGQLVSADDPVANAKIQGKKIMLLNDFRKKEDQHFCCGTIFQLREQRTLNAELILENENTLRINARYKGFSGSHTLERV